MNNRAHQTSMASIYLIMSSRRQETRLGRRTSQRMKLKMLRNLDEYKILNPYRDNPHPLPEALSKQIRQIDYLSAASISMLCLPLAPAHSHPPEHNLIKMAQALQEQDSRFQDVFGLRVLDLTELEQGQSHSEPMEQEPCSHSEAPPTHPSNEGNPLLKDEMHLQMYEDRSQMHENLFEERVQGVDQVPVMQLEQVSPLVSEGELPGALEEDFEQYFII